MEINERSEQIIGAAIEVHRAIGPGLLESAYEECLCYELFLREVPFRRQLGLPLSYKGIRLDCRYRVDLLVDETVVVEVKVLDRLQDIHVAQILTYLKIGRWPLGLLINFNVPVLKSGIKRVVNNLPEKTREAVGFGSFPRTSE